ncbi:MAG: glucose-methanol-choline oxidoreductase [Glaciihabitans sp.]|nr:glucose-methanol-choline oxidoreductase [Glaciihabitans sp.]
MTNGPGLEFSEAEQTALRGLVDAIVPADDYPSASASGGLEFLSRMLADRPDWLPRLRAIAAGAADDEEQLWFTELVVAGYFADPANGGNRDAESWRMIGWRPEPAGGWRAPLGAPKPATGIRLPSQLDERYDAIIVGSGAGGGVAAQLLTAAGRRVLVVEAGDWPDQLDLARDHLRNPRTTTGLDSLAGPPSAGNPRTVDVAGTTLTVGPPDLRWGNNAITAGGGTRVYGAQAWRFTPEDFRMASTYGTPTGSALADWPISYDDLEPFYTRAEHEIGVSGTAIGDSAGGPRSRDYPMPPLPSTAAARVLRAGAESLGLSTLPVPLLINSIAYNGRPACEQCAQCVGFACPIDAKNGSQNTALARALDSGRADLVLSTTAEAILTDAAGRVTGVRVVGERDGAVWRRDILAADVVLAAAAVETARLLLASRSEREPQGIGNNADQVGRHLQGHLYGGALAIFDEEVVDLLGPGPSIATCDYRHGNANIVGGGMLANEFVPTPVNTYAYLRSAGLIPAGGLEAKRGMRHLASRMQRVMGPAQEVSTADARVRLDHAVRDRFGNAVAALSGGLHPEDVRTQRFLADRSTEWLRASGAATIVQFPDARTDAGPSGGQHQAGTCRMGSDPRDSVVDPEGRVWGHDNLRIADGSVHVTNGGVNPVLTILANAYRTIDLMLR